MLSQYWPDELVNMLANGYSSRPPPLVSIMPLGLLSKDLPECFIMVSQGILFPRRINFTKKYVNRIAHTIIQEQLVLQITEQYNVYHSPICEAVGWDVPNVLNQ